jgi:hypothetical protein
LFSVRNRNQGVDSRLGLDDDIPSRATIAAIGTSLGNVAFPPKTDTSIATLAGDDFDFYTIDKHGTIADWHEKGMPIGIPAANSDCEPIFYGNDREK